MKSCKWRKQSIFFDKTKEVSANYLKDNFADLDFDVTDRADGHARYADVDHIGKVHLGPIVLFDE